MAEVLSVVASTISVVQLISQVAKSIVEVKQFWEQVKNIPSEIQDLLLELQILSPIIEQFETQVSLTTALPPSIWDNGPIKTALRHCQAVFTSLEGVTDQLNNEISSSSSRWLSKKLVSMRVVLKKPTMKKLEDKLRRAIHILQILMQLYTMSVLCIPRHTRRNKLIPSGP
jgi:hypothetical protein